MTPDTPEVRAPSLSDLSALAREFRDTFAPLGGLALASLSGQRHATPHDTDGQPVINVLPAVANRLIEIATVEPVAAADIPIPVRAEMLGRIARLTMELHGPRDVGLALSVGLMPANPVTAATGALN